LLPQGRNVKCGKCRYRWFADPPPHAWRADESYDPIRVTPLDPEEQAPFRARNLPAIAARPSARSTVAAWSLLVAMLAVLGGILWFGRAQLVTAMPVLQPLYQRIGVCVGIADPADSFRFSTNPTPSRTDSGALIIRGELVRESDCATYVPDIIVEFLDTERKVLQRTNYPVGIARLEQGRPTPFALTIAEWPDSIADINLVFTIPNVQG
jgi:hypothetical protein